MCNTFVNGCGCDGIQGYESQDSKLFASWGSDMIKIDACGTEGVRWRRLQAMQTNKKKKQDCTAAEEVVFRHFGTLRNAWDLKLFESHLSPPSQFWMANFVWTAIQIRNLVFLALCSDWCPWHVDREHQHSFKLFLAISIWGELRICNAQSRYSVRLFNLKVFFSYFSSTLGNRTREP